MLGRGSSRIVRRPLFSLTVKSVVRPLVCAARIVKPVILHSNQQHCKNFHSSTKMSDSSSRSPLLDPATPENSLFFLCDIQENFRDKMHNWSLLVSSSQFLTRVASALNIPVIVTEQKPFKPTITEMAINQSNSQSNGQAGGELSEKAFGHAVYSKSLFSMMTADVVKDLKAKHPNRKHVFLYGIEAHVCVMQTTLDLLRQGFIVHLPLDAITSMNKIDRDAAVARFQSMAHLGVILTSAESSAFEIVHDSANPSFKPLVPLIKEYAKTKAAAAQVSVPSKL